MDHQKLLKLYRLTPKEYQVIESYLEHTPSRLELALFSALWSEHCSYKSSAVYLKKLYFDSPRVLSALGENAGVVDLGQQEKLAFKIESHNHPSFITPYHGAATGVGGILRDIFVMNARPIGLANYLCFGDPLNPDIARLIKGVVSGIGGYGNSIGIPTITGQTEFNSSYNKNIVMNALALGYYGPEDKIMSSKAKGVGNILVYVGAHTGKDGIHGASMASKSFKKNHISENKTAVQIGDPFYGKLLMEVCLEVFKKELVIAAQDMGAAGLISSSFEMISKGDLGMKLYLHKVPLRDSSMTPEEILLSESQERVLLLVCPDKLEALKKVCDTHGLPVSSIGELTKNKEVELFWEQNLLLKINPDFLVKKAPRYNHPYKKWQAKYNVKDKAQTKCVKKDVFTVLLSLLQNIKACSRKPIYQQYDQQVGASTVKDCSFPLGVVCLENSKRALGVSLGGRPHIMKTDALEGGKDSVYEPALQLATRGFSSLALTDGLNFGSPENPEVMSSFVACIEGMARASRSLKTPVVSGNVSLYNETNKESINPTPATAMVGIKNSLSICPSDISAELVDSKVYLVSAHQMFCKGLIGDFYNEEPCFYGSLIPDVNNNFIQQILKAHETAMPQATRFVGKFGLVYTLCNMIKNSSVGLKIKTSYNPFQERLYEIIVVLKQEDVSVWENLFCSTKHPTNKKMFSFQIEELGVVVKKPTFCFNNSSVLVSKLNEGYERGGVINFT